MKAKPTTNNGFTLIELLVILSIAAILLSIATPSFTNMLQNNRISTQANEFIAALNLARSEAIKRGVTIDVVATAPSSSNEWGGGWSVAVNGGATIKTFAAFEGSSSLDSDNDISTIQYQASGRANVSETFSLCDSRSGETGRQLSISTTGRVSVSNLTCS